MSSAGRIFCNPTILSQPFRLWLQHPPWLSLLGLPLCLGCGGLLGDSSSNGIHVNANATGGLTSAGSANAGGALAQDTGIGGGTAATGGASTAGQPGLVTRGCDDIEICGYRSPNCGGVDCFSADFRTANVLMVIDTSAAMTNYVTATDSTRWSQLLNSLTHLLGSLGFDVDIGLEIFPMDAADNDPASTDLTLACQVPSGAAAIAFDLATDRAHRAAILESLNNRKPAGYSPAGQALEQAYWYFTEGNGKYLQGSKSVLFTTTGATDCSHDLKCDISTCAPNLDQSCPQGDAGVDCCTNTPYLCSDHRAVTAEIAKLADAGVKTYVIGMPASYDEFQILNTFAAAGQAPNTIGKQGEQFYWVDETTQGTDDLADALDKLSTQLVKTCDFYLSASPNDVDNMFVNIDCDTIAPATLNDPAGVDGWTIDRSQDPPHVQLVGSVCERINVTGAAQVNIAYNCSELSQ